MVTKTADLPFNAQHLDTWENEGGVLIEDFLNPNEVQAVAADFARVFDNTITSDKPGKIPAKATSPDKPPSFHPKQFKNFAAIPFDCSPALNLIGVHPALMAFARAALKTPNIHLYQCQAWAKFTGEADYNQPLHCDFANHTLTVPSENAAKNSVTILCYFSDVSEAHGPHALCHQNRQCSRCRTRGGFFSGPRFARKTPTTVSLQRRTCGEHFSIWH